MTAVHDRGVAPATGPELLITRTFDAPRELVWKAWTDPEHARRWWGPTGFTAPEIELATRPGERWRAVMVAPDGRRYPQHGVMREIVPPERLVYTFVWSERPEHEMLVSVTFEERGGKTEMTFRQTGFLTEVERDDHRGGWGETFDRLELALRESGMGNGE